MNHIKKLLILMGVGAVGCNNHRCATGAMYELYDTVANKEYAMELVGRLSRVAPEKMDVYMGDYSAENGREYLQVGMHSDSVCAVVKMDITDCAEMYDVKVTKGMSYRSAGIRGLKYKIDSGGGEVRFVMESIEDIID
jgi:hypothetical protein